ncbi:MAG: ATP-dependent nuclease [Phycisphaerales bacterium]
MLTRLEITGYRSLAAFTVASVPNPWTLIGGNNAGKSNVLRALEALLSDPSSALHDGDFASHHENGLPRPRVKITGVFDGGEYSREWPLQAHAAQPEKPPATFLFVPAFLLPAGHNFEAAPWDRRASFRRFMATIIHALYRAQIDPVTMAGALADHTCSFVRQMLPGTEVRVAGGLSLQQAIPSIFAAIVDKLDGAPNPSLDDIEFALAKPSSTGSGFSSDVELQQSIRLFDGHESHSFEKGHGAQRALILGLAIAAARTVARGRPTILALEEPELYFHSQQCEFVARTLQDIASTGSVQIVCATHSPEFVDPRRLGSVDRLQREKSNGLWQSRIPAGTEGTIRHRRNGVGKSQVAMLGLEIRNALFAKFVCVVEGPHDAEVLVELRPDMVPSASISCLVAGGCKGIPKVLRCLSKLGCRRPIVLDERDGQVRHDPSEMSDDVKEKWIKSTVDGALYGIHGRVSRHGESGVLVFPENLEAALGMSPDVFRSNEKLFRTWFLLQHKEAPSNEPWNRVSSKTGDIVHFLEYPKSRDFLRAAQTKPEKFPLEVQRAIADFKAGVEVLFSDENAAWAVGAVN